MVPWFHGSRFLPLVLRSLSLVRLFLKEEEADEEADEDVYEEEDVTAAEGSYRILEGQDFTPPESSAVV